MSDECLCWHRQELVRVNRLEFQGPGTRLWAVRGNGVGGVVAKSELVHCCLLESRLRECLHNLGLSPGLWTEIPAQQFLDKLWFRAANSLVPEHVQTTIDTVHQHVGEFNKIFWELE